MKFLVDVLPESKGCCPFSYWEIYPPIIEIPGDYYCNKDKKVCNLNEANDIQTECRWLKTTRFLLKKD